MDKVLTEQWITVAEAAAKMGVPVKHILELIRSGKLRGHYFAAESTTTH